MYCRSGRSEAATSFVDRLVDQRLRAADPHRRRHRPRGCADARAGSDRRSAGWLLLASCFGAPADSDGPGGALSIESSDGGAARVLRARAAGGGAEPPAGATRGRRKGAEPPATNPRCSHPVHDLCALVQFRSVISICSARLASIRAPLRSSIHPRPRTRRLSSVFGSSPAAANTALVAFQHGDRQRLGPTTPKI